MIGDSNLEEAAKALEASGEYRVLRRLRMRSPAGVPDGISTRVGLFVDVERTGLDPTRDEIIELAMTPFIYGLDGQVFSVGESFQQLRQPNCSIPPQITAITGLTDEIVADHFIDPIAVARFAAPAALVIAHNAAFDRRFLERFCTVFTTKPWACSMTQIDWTSEGFEGTKLAYLAGAAGFFYERHRAMYDCLAAIELLASPLPKSGGTGLANLLKRARMPSWRIWAENAPFELKEVLKARGYKWNAEAHIAPRAWYVDVADVDRDAELAFLRAEIYQSEISLLFRQIDALDRFSERG